MVRPSDNPNEFSKTVGIKETRKVRARAEKGRGIWFGLGMIGTVGWSVAVPTLAGVALGLWLDARYNNSGISWTLTLLFLGLVIGCLNAYYWVKRQLSATRRRRVDRE